MKAADSVRVSSVVDVPPREAFELFTRDVDLWWRRGPRYRPGVGRDGTMRFEDDRLVETYSDREPFEIGRVLVREPGARLVFEWRARAFDKHELTIVDIRFESHERGTQITLSHRGWESIPVDHAARHGLTGEAFRSMIGLYWGDLLVALRHHAKETK